MRVQEIQNYDRHAIEVLGISSLCLMENAGRAVADEIKRRLARTGGRAVVLVCGSGNNGGDGLVAARHLLSVGIVPRAFLVMGSGKMSVDAKVNLDILHTAGFPVVNLDTADVTFRKALAEVDIVVDALFGVGLNREIQEPFATVIEAINASARHVVAVDIPSGLDGDTGRARGVCVRANVTVTFTAAKQGFYLNDGPRHTGQVKVVPIGIPCLTKI